MQNSISLKPEKILVAIHQHVGACFFGGTKTEAKQAFNELRSGKHLPLLEISAGDRGSVVGVLALDASEFVGKLNYTAFRNALASHLNRVAERLKNSESLNILTIQDTGAMLFHVPGLVQVGNQVNVLVTGIEQSKPGELLIKLMFINPDNYRRQ